ncbi:thioredoxin [Panaeolus papilionaceus]|nr:thioredoxin [Panaeolus papilionaceus]
MPVTEIKSLVEFRQIINGDKPAVIDLWATWCGPCRVISPIFEKFSSETTEIDFYKVDVDTQQDIAQEVGVKAFHKGDKVGELVGAAPTKLLELVTKGKGLIKS